MLRSDPRNFGLFLYEQFDAIAGCPSDSFRQEVLDLIAERTEQADVIVLIAAAELQSRLGRDEEATTAWRSAIETAESVPQENWVYNEIAWRLATNQAFRDADRALEFARRARDLDPQNDRVLNTLGVAQYRAGKYRDAIDTLTRANIKIRQTKVLPYNLYVLAMCYWKCGEEQMARARLKEARRNNPTDEQLLRFRAEAEELIVSHESDEPR
jgi:lipopolysaccharide biosynthesis regulator YciM